MSENTEVEVVEAVETVEVETIGLEEVCLADIEAHKNNEDVVKVPVYKSAKEAIKGLLTGLQGNKTFKSHVQAFIVFATKHVEVHGDGVYFDKLRQFLPAKGGSKGSIMDFCENHCGVKWEENVNGDMIYKLSDEPINQVAIDKGWWLSSKDNIPQSDFNKAMTAWNNVVALIGKSKMSNEEAGRLSTQIELDMGMSVGSSNIQLEQPELAIAV